MKLQVDVLYTEPYLNIPLFCSHFHYTHSFMSGNLVRLFLLLEHPLMALAAFDPGVIFLGEPGP